MAILFGVNVALDSLLINSFPSWTLGLTSVCTATLLIPSEWTVVRMASFAETAVFKAERQKKSGG